MGANRWKVLPHRITEGRRAGQCRDCGRQDVASAPNTCPRCMIERYGDRGHFTIVDPVSAYEVQGRELWRQVAHDLRAGQLRSDRFYIWIGHGDGGPLERPLDELLDNEREFGNARVAHETALDLTCRYPQVWVITTVGGWDVTSGLK